MGVVRSDGGRVLRHDVPTAGSSTGSATRRGGRSRALFATVLLTFSAVPFLALSATGVAAVAPSPGVSPTLNDAGFPDWFEDVNGVRVSPCLDPLDTNCLAPLTGPGYDANAPLVFPTNFPDEFFYSAADSEPMPVVDCSVAPTGVVSVHLALEAAFANGAVAPGDQQVFGRIRMRASADSGLCGDAWYTFRTPYGPVTVQTDPDGTILGARAAANTSDIGCFPTPVVPCDWNQVLAAPILGVGLLVQAPDELGAPTQVPGYLGSGAFAPVTGGAGGFNSFEVVKWPEGVTPTSSGLGVDCDAAECLPLASTSNFQVLAKVAGPLGASDTSINFGGQVVEVPAAAGAAKPVTITNIGAGLLGKDPSTITGVVLTGADAANFGVTAGTCESALLPRDATCAVGFNFAPDTNRVFSARAEVTIAESTRPLVIDLVGTGIGVNDAPLPTQNTQNIDFGQVRLTTVSATETLTILNSGSAPLLAEPSIDADGIAAGFQKGLDTCTGTFVPAGASCTVGFRYQPNDAGVLHSTTVTFNSNSAGLGVTLTGASWGGVAAVSDTIDPVNTFPDWYQDERGVRVGQCDQPTNPLCISAPVPDGGSAQSFPANYPDEWFYYMVQSAPLDASDAECGAGAGSVMVEIATEAAFLGPVEPFGGITFGRLRIVARGGLCPETTYKFTHPYGQTLLTTDDAGDIKPTAGTQDVGCVATPCDYHQALSAVVLEGYMEQSNRPAGWLGDPVNPGTATGAPYMDAGQPFNRFTVERIDGLGGVIAETDQFGITGRLVGPIVSDPTSWDFGGAEMGLVSAEVDRAFTFTNTGVAAVTLDSTAPLTLDGDETAQFAIQDGSTCTVGAVLQPGESCTVNVHFAPSTTGPMTTTLTLHHSGKNSPTGVALSGLGVAPAGAAAISSSLNPVRFIDLHVGGQSQTVSVHIANAGGSSALVLAPFTLADGSSFAIAGSTCVTDPLSDARFIQPGEGCFVSLRFQPTATGPLTDSITFVSNAITGDLTVNLVGRATAANAAVAGATNGAGFPIWLQDHNGIRLEQCLVNDGSCVLLGDATFNPSLAVAFPTNYPGESFYTIADSDIVTFGAHLCTANGAVRAAGGTAMLRMATEATFLSSPPTAGSQTLFNRIRITADGLCPLTAYTFETPYGTQNITTDGAGEIRATTDVEALRAPSGALAAGFLRWDPNVAPAAPAGYIGHPGVLHTVVGSKVFDLTGEPVNRFSVRSPLTQVGSTDKFLLAGRLAGPVVANPTTKDFGVREFGTDSSSQTFTISNIGNDSVSSFVASLEEAGADQFAITGTTCAAATLELDQSCTVTVSFLPTEISGAGLKTARLVVGHDGLRSPVTIALSGTSIAAQTPALTVSPASVAFGNVIVNTNSNAVTVTVRNAGTGNLRLDGIAVGGLNSSDFTAVGCRSNNVLVDLQAGQSCLLSVVFRPGVKAARVGNIKVTATDITDVAFPGHLPVAIPAATVALSGTGVQGTITPSATTASISARAGGSQTFKLTLTNSGNANFSLQSTLTEAALKFEFVSTNRTNLTQAQVLNKFRVASTGCANVAPGKNCQVTITFTPGNVAVNAQYKVNLIINSNASNNRIVMGVTGTQVR